MAFFRVFGLDGWLIYAQIVNFTIVLVILTVLFYKPVMRELKKEEERRRKLAEDEAAHTALLTERTKALTDAKTQARAIIHEAEDIAVHIKREMSEQTQKEKAAAVSQFTAHLTHVRHEKNQNAKK